MSRLADAWDVWRGKAKVQRGTMQRSVTYGESYSVKDPNILSLFGIDNDSSFSLEAGNALPAAFACISLISRDLSSLDWGIFSRNDKRKPHEDHPAYPLISRKPDMFMTKTQWMEVMLRNALGFGDAFAEVMRDSVYRPYRLRFWKWNEVGVTEHADGTISYTTPKAAYLPYEDMIHFKFHSIDGKRGRTPIEVARTMIEESLSMEQHNRNFYKQGAKVPGYLKVPSRLQDLPSEIVDEQGNEVKSREGARQRLSKNWQEAKNSGRTPLLEEGVEFVPTNMSFGDAQFLQMRDSSFNDVCSIYGCPPMLVQRYMDAKYATSEQADLGYLKHTLAPYIDHIREELEEKLLNTREQKRYMIDTDIRKLAKADVASMTSLYETLLDKQVWNRNDVLKDLGMGTREGYDEHMLPAGLMPEQTAREYYGSKGEKVNPSTPLRETKENKDTDDEGT